MKILKIIFASIILTSLAGCEELAVMFTPKKQPVASQSELSKQAENKFWNTLHQGRYSEISDADKMLTAAYLENPNDPKIAAHLGFLHIWKITERYRMKEVPATIVDEIILSKKYFKDSHELNPADTRITGFYGDSQLVTGQIFHDEREQTRGYFTLKRAISAWPEFNYFTGGYVMSVLSPDSKNFKEGLEWQWKTMDLCAEQKINRNNPDFTPYMHLETQQGPKRACWNSWIAPYNFEGFFLNMGDMLVKAGDVNTAIKIYNNAKLAKNYSSWPFKNLLEKRIQNAQENIKNFQQEFISPDKSIMFNGGYGCVACHQNPSSPLSRG